MQENNRIGIMYVILAYVGCVINGKWECHDAE